MATLPHRPAGLDLLLQLASARRFEPACERFYFLRHGQTGRNALRIFQAPDEPLSELGHAQAARAAELLAGEPLAAIVCSDARRAHDTALAVAVPHGQVPLPQIALRERNFGALIGTSSAHIDWACEPEGGETLAEFVDRTHAALETALAHPGPVLVVAHGGTLYVLAALLGQSADAAMLGNAQPLRVQRDASGWRIEALAEADGTAAALA